MPCPSPLKYYLEKFQQMAAENLGRNKLVLDTSTLLNNTGVWRGSTRRHYCGVTIPGSTTPHDTIFIILMILITILIKNNTQYLPSFLNFSSPSTSPPSHAVCILTYTNFPYGL